MSDEPDEHPDDDPEPKWAVHIGTNIHVAVPPDARILPPLERDDGQVERRYVHNGVMYVYGCSPRA